MKSELENYLENVARELVYLSLSNEMLKNMVLTPEQRDQMNQFRDKYYKLSLDDLVITLQKLAEQGKMEF